MFARFRVWVSDFASDWGGPIGLGLAAAVIVWVVWYFTRAACTTTAATNGLCNPGLAARFIDVEILLKSGGAALAVGALKGGYDKLMMRRMLNEEREARQQAEQQLAAERKRVDEVIEQVIEERRQAIENRDSAFQMIADVVSELREERRQSAEERRLSAATQQALLDTIVRLTEQRNGRNGDAENA